MRIQFLKDTSKAIIPCNLHNENTLVLFRDGYKLPDIPNAKFMEFEKYRNIYSEIHPKSIIIFGLNRIITPSNRCDFVFEYLQTTTNHIKKISIDTAPFIGEPWRLWFHYSVCMGSFLGINYSYAIETDWQHWFYRDTEKCLLLDTEVSKSINETYSDIDLLKTEFVFHEASYEDKNWYFEAKEFVFNKYETPKLIISNLLKMVNDRYQIKINFDSYLINKQIKLPDLGIYRFMKEENERRMKIFNVFIKN